MQLTLFAPVATRLLANNRTFCKAFGFKVAESSRRCSFRAQGSLQALKPLQVGYGVAPYSQRRLVATLVSTPLRLPPLRGQACSDTPCCVTYCELHGTCLTTPVLQTRLSLRSWLPLASKHVLNDNSSPLSHCLFASLPEAKACSSPPRQPKEGWIRKLLSCSPGLAYHLHLTAAIRMLHTGDSLQKPSPVHDVPAYD